MPLIIEGDREAEAGEGTICPRLFIRVIQILQIFRKGTVIIMTNLLCSDFYRLFKSKSFYICTAVAMFFMGLSIFIVKWAATMTSKEEGGAAVSMMYKDGITYGITSFASSNVQLILSIIIAIFVTSEFTYGTMKNVVSKGFSKVQIYFSKLITMIAATLIIIFATVLTGTVCAAIITGKLGAVSPEVLKIIGIETLLNTARASLFVLVAFLVRNLGGAIAINIIGVISIEPMIFMLLQYLAKNKIKFSDFSLSFNISCYFGSTVQTEDYIRSLIVGVVFLAVSIIAGIFAFQKADVK
jgi:hypothetical protein